MTSKHPLYLSLRAAVEGNTALPDRFRFDQKELLWVANGAVFRENYTFEGGGILVKVEPLLTDFVRYEGVYPIESYSFTPSTLTCDGQKYFLEHEKASRMLRFKQREVGILNYLANVDVEERFVRRFFCVETGKDHELFFANGSLYVRSLMKEKKGVCLGDKSAKYVTGNESTVGLIHPLDIVKLAKDVGEGLLLLQEWNIVHRDVKRSNILRNVKAPGKSFFSLVDFGTACFNGDETDKGLEIGTNGYKAPEIIRGEGGSHYSDIWAFGAALYGEMMENLPFSNIPYRQIDQTHLVPLYNKIISDLPFNHTFVDAAVNLLHGDVDVCRRSLDELLTVANNILQGKDEILYTTQKSSAPKKKADFNATRQQPFRPNVGGGRLAAIGETFREGVLDEQVRDAMSASSASNDPK